VDYGFYISHGDNDDKERCGVIPYDDCNCCIYIYIYICC